MFINKLGLKNFKCFKEVEVDFSKITLLTGENSSGKSSLIYGLLAPFQSEDFPLYLFPNGKYVNMGDFEEISFNNLKNNTIEINLDVRNILQTSVEDWLTGFNIHTKWILDSSNQLPKLSYEKIFLLNKDECSHIIEIKNFKDHYKCDLSDKSETPLVKDLQINKLDEINGSIKMKQDIYQIFSRILTTKRLLKRIESNLALNFISSYRFSPERTYYQKTKSSSKVFPSGEGFIDQILEWQEKNNEQFNRLLIILKDLKLLYDIKPHKIGGGRFDFRVKVKRGSNWASLADVGFGVSQLLPIIVADLQLNNKSTLIMAQPETHLHPSIQAELGTYLVKQVNQLEKQYVVETHSEYLINRLRLSIVKGEIESEDVAVYYFENTVKEGSIAHRIEFTKQGQILNAPQGFFDTYMMDTMNIALNA